MAGSVNKVILVGNLGKDPEVRRLNSGDQVVNFTLATSESWRDKNSGERKEKTEWHNVVIFNGNLGKVVEQYCKKGSKVYVEGQLQTRKWQDKDSADRYTTEVVLQRFRGGLTLLDSRNGGGDRQSFPDEERAGAPRLRQVLKRRPPPGALQRRGRGPDATTTFRSEGRAPSPRTREEAGPHAWAAGSLVQSAAREACGLLETIILHEYPSCGEGSASAPLGMRAWAPMAGCPQVTSLHFGRPRRLVPIRCDAWFGPQPPSAGNAGEIAEDRVAEIITTQAVLTDSFLIVSSTSDERAKFSRNRSGAKNE